MPAPPSLYLSVGTIRPGMVQARGTGAGWIACKPYDHICDFGYGALWQCCSDLLSINDEETLLACWVQVFLWSFCPATTICEPVGIHVYVYHIYIYISWACKDLDPLVALLVLDSLVLLHWH